MVQNGFFGDFFAAEGRPNERKSETKAKGEEESRNIVDGGSEGDGGDGDDIAPEIVGADTDAVGAENGEGEVFWALNPDVFEPHSPRFEAEPKRARKHAFADRKPKKWRPDGAWANEIIAVGVIEGENKDSFGDDPNKNCKKHQEEGVPPKFEAVFVATKQGGDGSTENKNKSDELKWADILPEHQKTSN